MEPFSPRWSYTEFAQLIESAGGVVVVVVLVVVLVVVVVVVVLVVVLVLVVGGLGKAVAETTTKLPCHLPQR